MTGSAKQSMLPRKGRMDCFVAFAPRNDVHPDMPPRSRGAMRPSFAKTMSLDNQRAQGMPGANCTRSLACESDKAHEHSHHRFRRIQPAFPAQWFYGLLRALPGDQACLTPSPALLIADLTPALGRQNDTTSPSAAAQFVKRTARVHRIPPHVDDVAQRPSFGTGRDESVN